MPASVSMGRKWSVSSGVATPPSMAVSQTWKWRSTLSLIWARRSRSWSMAAFSRRKVSSKSSMSVGLSRYSATWLRMDMFRYLKSLYPLRITILTWGYSRLSRCISSTPSIPGIRMSDRTTSGLQSSIRSSTSWPLAQTPPLFYIYYTSCAACCTSAVFVMGWPVLPTQMNISCSRVFSSAVRSAMAVRAAAARHWAGVWPVSFLKTRHR